MEYITKRRKEELRPKFEKFLSWLEEIKPRNKGKYSMSKAIQLLIAKLIANTVFKLNCTHN